MTITPSFSRCFHLYLASSLWLRRISARLYHRFAFFGLIYTDWVVFLLIRINFISDIVRTRRITLFRFSNLFLGWNSLSFGLAQYTRLLLLILKIEIDGLIFIVGVYSLHAWQSFIIRVRVVLLILRLRFQTLFSVLFETQVLTVAAAENLTTQLFFFAAVFLIYELLDEASIRNLSNFPFQLSYLSKSFLHSLILG